MRPPDISLVRYRPGALYLLIMGGICVMTSMIYGTGLSGDFLGDSLGFLHEAALRVRQGGLVTQGVDVLTSRIPTEVGFVYRPLSVVSFVVDYLVWNVNPFGWHLTSLLLHSHVGGAFFGRNGQGTLMEPPLHQIAQDLQTTLIPLTAGCSFRFTKCEDH